MFDKRKSLIFLSTLSKSKFQSRKGNKIGDLSDTVNSSGGCSTVHTYDVSTKRGPRAIRFPSNVKKRNKQGGENKNDL